MDALDNPSVVKAIVERRFNIKLAEKWYGTYDLSCVLMQQTKTMCVCVCFGRVVTCSCVCACV